MRKNVAPEEISAILGVRDPRTDAVGDGDEAGRFSGKHGGARVKVAGFGGQGVLFLGKLLAEVGMAEGFHVSWLPSWDGPEMRGGTANCHVNISHTPVGSPLISDPSVLIALNRLSLDWFEGRGRPGGAIIYDTSLIDLVLTRQDVEVVAIPATEIAERIGSPKVANMVAVGAFMGVTSLSDTTISPA